MGILAAGPGRPAGSDPVTTVRKGIVQRTASRWNPGPDRQGHCVSQLPGPMKVAVMGGLTYSPAMSIKIGYARCSTRRQDLEAQRKALLELGVSEDRIYTDHGLTGTNRARPGLDQALAALREGDTLIVSKLDRLARSVPDAREIAGELEKRGVRLAFDGTIYDPADPMGKMFFNIVATFAEFEAGLGSMRTSEGMALASANGKLKGKPPKLSPKQQKELGRMHGTGEYSISDLAEIFSVSRATVYRTLERLQIA